MNNQTIGDVSNSIVQHNNINKNINQQAYPNNNKLVIWCCCLSILNIVTFVLCFMNVKPDYYHILIASVSIIVAVLIGWQIYNGISLQKIITQSQAEQTKLKETNFRIDDTYKTLYCLLEAFQLYQSAKESNSMSNKYCLAFKSLRSLILSNADVNHVLFINILSIMKHSTQHLKEEFDIDPKIRNNLNRECDPIFDEIISITFSKKEFSKVIFDIKEIEKCRKLIL